MHRIRLYTRDGCHLCSDAAALLRQSGWDFDELDVDRDPALMAEFDTCVPVIEIDGKVRFRGRINPILLRRTLSTMGGAPGD